MINTAKGGRALRYRLSQTVLAGALVLLVACAQSPQQIQLAPQLPAPEAAQVAKFPVHIRVSDQRASKVLGSRGGAYRDTATITLGNDLSTAVQGPLKQHMSALGYDTDSLGAETVDLHVIFDQLVYNHPEEDGVGYDMDMLALVRVEAAREGEHYEGRYQIKRKQKFFNAPSDQHNTELLNQLVVDVLNNMLADQDLINFLARK